MSLPPAFRFLGLVVGGWVGLRVIAWLPQSPATDAVEAPGEQVIAAAPTEGSPIEHAGATVPVGSPAGSPAPVRASGGADGPTLPISRAATMRPTLRADAAPPMRLSLAAPIMLSPTQPAAEPAGSAAPPALGTLSRFADRSSPTAPSRWSAYAYVFVRDGGGVPLLPGSALGGSQAGARVTYRVNGDSRRPLALSARLTSPLDSLRGAEAAIGVDWQPLPRIPIHLLAERRQRLGSSGRSDWQLTAYGGVERRRGRVRIDAYGQAGIIGIDHPDLFADGAVRAGVAIGPVEVGGGAWGGAQPGASRLDIGPRAGTRLRVGGVTLRAEADWRFRVAGSATPGSGPALTLSAGF